MEKKFYVYIHRRASDGTVFYVGKGTGRRAWSIHSRNKWWTSVANKHGFCVEIVKSEMTEDCAFTLEKITIFLYKKYGSKLVNQSMGGEGNTSGNGNTKKPVVCSNGMTFLSVRDAAKWAEISESHISSVCRGKKMTAAGYTWAYVGNRLPEYSCPRKRISEARNKPVVCSNGMEFPSAKEAANWLKETFGVSGARGNISYAISGKINSAYGFTWKFKETA